MNWARGEWAFLLLAMAICFLTGTEYAVTRPASGAIFITVFSSSIIPWAWLATVPLNLLVVYLYNRILPKIGPFRMVASVAAITVIVNILCGLFLSTFPQLIFFHFVWKDIYILLMFKQLWSMIHTTITPEKAKYWYGVVFGMGTLGSIIGSITPGFFAVDIGSETLFFFTAPIYALLTFCYWRAMRYSSIGATSFQEQGTGEGGVSLVFKSKPLLAILALVIFMQVSVALVEYQFNYRLEREILEQDLRTEYCGKIFGLTSLISAAFQFIGSFVLIHVLGVRRSHLTVPAMLFVSSIVSWVIPTFALATFSLMFVKAIDFSIFGVAKEMLYIPLKTNEKYHAKAIIDVFAYRSSKALISVAILGLQLFLGEILGLASLLSIALFAAWLFFAMVYFRKTGVWSRSYS